MTELPPTTMLLCRGIARPILTPASVHRLAPWQSRNRRKALSNGRGKAKNGRRPESQLQVGCNFWLYSYALPGIG